MVLSSEIFVPVGSDRGSGLSATAGVSPGGHQTEMHEGYVRVRVETGLPERPCRVLPGTVVEADSLGTESRRWQSILLWKNVIV